MKIQTKRKGVLADQAYFQAFYEENKNLMYYIARQYTDECEDLVQESLIRLLHHVDTLKSMNHNTCARYIELTIRAVYIDTCLRKKRVQTVPLEELPLLTGDLAAPRELLGDLRVRLLRESLNPRDWMVLEGKYLLGLNHKELGQLLQVAPNSVRMILSRAKSKARKILQQDMEGGDKGYDELA